MTLKFLFTLIVLISFQAVSQNTISGIVKDEYNNPLPYANIVLLKPDTSDIIKGVISDNRGIYNIRIGKNGSYLIEVSIIGYKTIESEIFTIAEGETKKIDFQMGEETQALDEVVVKGQRPIIKQIGGKLVVDIENSEIVSSNLQDVMKKVPGIIVTNGNLSYAGKQGVTILINGKTTRYMDISALLKNLPADNIAKVELIQQPGAEFDAQGTGPFINIILKKNISLGTHGSIKANSGYDNRPEYGTSFMISSYKNKLNWQIGTGYKKMHGVKICL